MAVVATSVMCLRHDKESRKNAGKAFSIKEKAAFKGDYISVQWLNGTVSNGILDSITNGAIILKSDGLINQAKIMRPVSDISDFKILVRKSKLV